MPTVSILRSYPRGFGECLLQLHGSAKERLFLHMRQKQPLNPELTDLQIFCSLSDSDCWADAQLPSVFLYLYEKATIPDQWHHVMKSFKTEMEKYVTRLHMVCVCSGLATSVYCHLSYTPAIWGDDWGRPRGCISRYGSLSWLCWGLPSSGLSWVGCGSQKLEFDLQVGFWWQILQNTSKITKKPDRFSAQNAYKNIPNDNKYRQTATNPKKYIK